MHISLQHVPPCRLMMLAAQAASTAASKHELQKRHPPPTPSLRPFCAECPPGSSSTDPTCKTCITGWAIPTWWSRRTLFCEVRHGHRRRICSWPLNCPGNAHAALLQPMLWHAVHAIYLPGSDSLRNQVGEGCWLQTCAPGYETTLSCRTCMTCRNTAAGCHPDCAKKCPFSDYYGGL